MCTSPAPRSSCRARSSPSFGSWRSTPGRIVTHQHLLREVWGPAHEHETHYLRIYIGHLRQKLGDDPADPRYISNEPGVGYRLLEGDG